MIIKPAIDRWRSGGQMMAILRLRRVYPHRIMPAWNHQYERRPSECRERWQAWEE